MSNMRLDLPDLVALARETVQNPQIGARRILTMDLPLPIASLALLIVALLTAILSALVSLIGQNAGLNGAMIGLTPLNWVEIQVVGMFFGAGAIHVIGGWFGGTGRLEGAVAVLAWAQFLVLIVQVVQLIALFLLPPLSVPLALLGVGLTFWLLSGFIAELHGFPSKIKVLLGIVVSGFGLTLLVSVLLASLFAAVGV